MPGEYDKTRYRGSRQKIGGATILVELDTLKAWFGLNRQSGYAFLSALKVPLVHIRNNAYFNLYQLDKALFYVTHIGNKNFASPGSKPKVQGRAKRMNKYDIEITDEDLKRMETPEFIAEFYATSPISKTRSSYKSELKRIEKEQKKKRKADAKKTKEKTK